MPESDEPVFTQVTRHIREGAFSVLSDRAQNKLMDLIRWSMDDGYKRGFAAGQEAEKLRVRKKGAR